MLYFVLGGGKGGGNASAIPNIDSSVAASDLAKRVTLTPADWGPEFTQDSPYESSELSGNTVDQNCNYVSQTLDNALATLRRNVKKPDGAVIAVSIFTAYQATGSAQSIISRHHDELQRCTAETQGKVRFDDVHAAAIPEIKGFDEVVAEEGHQATDQNGQKADISYTYLTGRKGKFVLEAESDSAPGSQVQNRSDTVSALQLMLRRLENGGSK
ncbi:hypothetical protein [Streptomyces sp. CB02959]|uniref:hypothetical protein n=1 Tax=Streptomyces sp. CB02959 TaxID=2020330 RepID=UPI0011AF18C5|nr:hypothetical protein [Streptomyces sp. CB02959]